MRFTIKMPIMTITRFNKNSSLINSIIITLTLISKNTQTQAIFKTIIISFSLHNHYHNLRRIFMQIISLCIPIKALMTSHISNRTTIKINNQCTTINNNSNSSTQGFIIISIKLTIQTTHSSLKDPIPTWLISLTQCFSSQVQMATDNGRKS